MPAPILQFKRGNAGVAGTVPALRPGEPAISLNNFDFFIGIDTSVVNNKFFGSHRYWGREDGTDSLNLKLVDKDGTNYVAIKAPNTLAGNVTYTLPGTQGGSSSVLTNDGSGNLTWASGSANPVFTGIATFSDTTDNTLGDSNTGAVRIDGGLGIDKNVTVGGNLNVQGHSEFVGVVTFKGGTINLGDQDTDDINVAGEFISNLVPNTDNTYDIGVGGKRWRSANFSGISTFNNVIVGGASTALLVTGDTRIVGILTIGNASITFSGVNNQITGITTLTGFTDLNEGINVDGHTELDNVNVSVALTSTALTVGTGVGITQFSSAVGSGTSASSVPTSSAVIDYVGTQIGAVDLTTSIAGDSGTGSVSTSQTFTIAGTASEIETSASGQTITVGLPDAVVVGTSLSAPTVRANIIQSQNTGATAITINANDVTIADDLTVGGNLYVNGSTTQVNTSAITVEDRTIELGVVDGSAPSSATTWDLGVLFNYYTDAAKKSAVIWEQGDSRFKFASVLGADSNGTNNNTPQLTVTTFAPIEVGALWITDCAGTSQVISCTGTERFLENITVDAGTF
jgi:hypothetical protein